jgi:hypothetical protein
VACDLLIADVEKAAAHRGVAGFHADCNKEAGRAGRLIAELVNRETARGAERAKDLIDSMMKDLTGNMNLREGLMEGRRWFEFFHGTTEVGSSSTALFD